MFKEEIFERSFLVWHVLSSRPFHILLHPRLRRNLELDIKYEIGKIRKQNITGHLIAFSRTIYFFSQLGFNSSHITNHLFWKSQNWNNFIIFRLSYNMFKLLGFYRLQSVCIRTKKIYSSTSSKLHRSYPDHG